MRFAQVAAVFGTWCCFADASILTYWGGKNELATEAAGHSSRQQGDCKQLDLLI